MGAGRERLVRQMMTESLVLARWGRARHIGGLCGLAAAGQTGSRSLPIAKTPSVDLRVLLFAGLISGLTGIGFGVAPGAARVAIRI